MIYIRYTKEKYIFLKHKRILNTEDKKTQDISCVFIF